MEAAWRRAAAMPREGNVARALPGLDKAGAWGVRPQRHDKARARASLAALASPESHLLCSRQATPHISVRQATRAASGWAGLARLCGGARGACLSLAPIPARV